MRRFLQLVLVFTACMGFAQTRESILHYDSLITVERSGEMLVTEKIQVRCCNEQIVHGIYRDFPTRYRDGYGNRVNVAFEVQSVTRDGKPEQIMLENRANGIRVYAGNRYEVIPPGIYTYAITYRTNHQLGFFKDHDELYWNVTGNGWTFPIEAVSATVVLPTGAQVVDTHAFTGAFGQQGQNFKVEYDAYGRVVFRTTKALNPAQGLTLAVMWPKGFVVEPTRHDKVKRYFDDNPGGGVGLAGILCLVVYYGLVWLAFGKDPHKGVIIPLYEPPHGLSPAGMRYLMQMGYDDKTFASALVDMAVKGYLSIEEREDGKYKLEKVSQDFRKLSKEEMLMDNNLFEKNSVCRLDAGYASQVLAAVAAVKKSLQKVYDNTYFHANKGSLVLGVLISVFTVLALAVISEESDGSGMAIVWISLCTGGSAILLGKAIARLRNTVRHSTIIVLGIFAALIVLLVALSLMGFEWLGFWRWFRSASMLATACSFAVVLVNFIFYYLMKAPTVFGRAVMDKIEGFKLYLSVAEKDRLNILNPPEKTPEVFEKFLPYAMALDVEQAWCDQFADAFSKIRMPEQVGVDGGRYYPRWYGGRSFQHEGLTGLSSGLQGLSGSISAASIPPGTTSSGGYGGGYSGGGFGGGGFSGGGGGGGGGGGW